jgi:hypothetical protein
MNGNTIIRYEPCMGYELSKDITDEYGVWSYYLGYLKLENIRFIGYTIVGIIQDNKLLIKYSVCNYEDGDRFVKRIGVSEALNNTTCMEVDLTEVPQNETIRVFHGYCDLHVIPHIERRYLKKRQKYWLTKV